MSSFPETSEELEEFLKGFFEACREQDKTTGDFQQGPSIPEITKDSMFNGDQMTAPEGYQASYEHHMIDPQNQINNYGQMTSSCAENIYRGELEILGGEHTLHGYQTAVYRGHQKLSVDPQVTSPVGGPHISDWHTKTPGFNTIHPQINKTNSSEKENLLQYAETIASYTDTFHFGQMKTTPVEENVCPGQKRSPNVERSQSPQRTSFGNPTPYLGGSTCPSSPFVSQSQHLGSISVSPSVQGWLSQKKSDMVTQKHVTQNKAPSLKRNSCSYQDCEKSYTKSCHLKDHMKKHTGEKPYRCSEPECPWIFFCSSDLRRHERKHRGQRPYPCATCNKNFSRLYYLKTHQKVCIQASPSAGT